jgi:hypothetical protein
MLIYKQMTHASLRIIQDVGDCNVGDTVNEGGGLIDFTLPQTPRYGQNSTDEQPSSVYLTFIKSFVRLELYHNLLTNSAQCCFQQGTQQVCSGPPGT